MDIRRKKLVYRANYRGFKEAELILGGFARKYVDNFTEDELTIFEDLLTAKDHDIYDWITGKQPVPANYDTPLFMRIRAFNPIV